MTVERCDYPTCLTEAGYSKLFYFYRLSRLLPHQYYMAVLEEVYRDGDVLIGGIGAKLLGADWVGLHDLDIVTDRPGCLGECVERGERHAVSVYRGVVVRHYCWCDVSLRRDDVVKVGRFLVASRESTVAWWLRRTLSFAFGRSDSAELEEIWRYRAPKALAELVYMYLTWGGLDMAKVRSYLAMDRRYAAFVESLPTSALARQACAILYDHFGYSVRTCLDDVARFVASISPVPVRE
ncbi:MAG: hypothetical protein ACPL3C_06540 [Pyrobaculum sp.]